MPVQMPAGDPVMDPLRHCRQGYAADPRDSELSDRPVRYELGSGRVDMFVSDAVQAWMREHEWPRMYAAWHAVRRFDYYCGESNTLDDESNPCPYAREQAQAGLSRAPIQHCAKTDGLAFLMMHRQLLDLLRIAFPTHAQLVAGFEHVPRSQSDPENPIPELPVVWTPEQLAAIERLEQIEEHVAEFPDEDALGAYIQCAFSWTPANPRTPQQDPTAGVLTGMYNLWSVLVSPGALGSPRTRVINRAFFRIHGFIDQVWERYRRARGLGTSDPAYASAYLAQCDELHTLATHAASRPEATADGLHGAAPTESGTFAQTIRPMLEARCATCHGATMPAAELTLGGSGVTSAAIHAGSVGVPASNGNYALIEPGSAERSWLYLKASGRAAEVTCESACNRGVMPPSGQPGLSAAQLSQLAQWINAGAPP